VSLMQNPTTARGGINPPPTFFFVAAGFIPAQTIRMGTPKPGNGVLQEAHVAPIRSNIRYKPPANENQCRFIITQKAFQIDRSALSIALSDYLPNHVRYRASVCWLVCQTHRTSADLNGADSTHARSECEKSQTPTASKDGDGLQPTQVSQIRILSGQPGGGSSPPFRTNDLAHIATQVIHARLTLG